MSDREGSPTQAERKPKPEGEGAGGESLNIKIVNTNGDEVHFKIKKTTKLNKLKKAYAERVGAEISSIRLLFDGTRIMDDQTAADLDIEEGDAIEVLLEQVGGC